MTYTFTPTTGEGKAVENLRNSIAASSTWQGLLGVTTEAAALPSIYDGYADDKNLSEADFPRAILDIESFNTERIGTGTYTCQGSIEINLEFVSPSEHDRPSAYRWVKQQCALLRQDIRSLGEQGGNYLNISSFEMADEVAELDPKQANIRLGKNCRLWGAKFRANFWGGGPA